MNSKDDVLCVAYAADDNYAKLCGVSLISLFENNKDFEQIHVYVLNSGISKNNIEKLTGLGEKYNRQINFLDVEERLNDLNLRMASRKIAVASYARLFLPLLIPDKYNKILYLDCDTVVCLNLMELWRLEIGNCSIGGVRDTVDKFFMDKIALGQNESYVNAGVLLINLDMWRRENISEAFFKVIEEFSGKVPHHDQGVINKVCNTKMIIPSQYNMTTNMYSFSSQTIKNIYSMDKYYSQEELNQARLKPGIIHYTTGIYGRPWEENCIHPMRQVYLEIAQRSPWGNNRLLPDSRGFTVKSFGFLYNNGPKFLAEFIYKALNWMFHLKD